MTDVDTKPLAYTPVAAAEAMQVSRAFIYKLIKSGDLKTVKIGRSRRIPASELARLLSEGTES